MALVLSGVGQKPGHFELLQATRAEKMQQAVQRAVEARERAEALASRYAVEGVDAELNRWAAVRGKTSGLRAAAGRLGDSAGQELAHVWSIKRERERLALMQKAYRDEKHEEEKEQDEQRQLKVKISRLLQHPKSNTHSAEKAPLQQLPFGGEGGKRMASASNSKAARQRAARLRRSKTLKYRYRTKP